MGDDTLKIDKRISIDKEVLKNGRTYDGQMSYYGGPKEEHGIGRVQWSDGDIYEGENHEGAK